MSRKPAMLGQKLNDKYSTDWQYLEVGVQIYISQGGGMGAWHPSGIISISFSYIFTHSLSLSKPSAALSPLKKSPCAFIPTTPSQSSPQSSSSRDFLMFCTLKLILSEIFFLPPFSRYKGTSPQSLDMKVSVNVKSILKLMRCQA